MRARVLSVLLASVLPAAAAARSQADLVAVPPPAIVLPGNGDIAFMPGWRPPVPNGYSGIVGFRVRPQPQFVAWYDQLSANDLALHMSTFPQVCTVFASPVLLDRTIQVELLYVTSAGGNTRTHFDFAYCQRYHPTAAGLAPSAAPAAPRTVQSGQRPMTEREALEMLQWQALETRYRIMGTMVSPNCTASYNGCR